MVVLVVGVVAVVRIAAMAASTSSIWTPNSAAAVRRSVPSSGASRPSTMSPTLAERSETSRTSVTCPPPVRAAPRDLGDRVLPVVQLGLHLEELGASLGEGDRPVVPVGVDLGHLSLEGVRLVLVDVEGHQEGGDVGGAGRGGRGGRRRLGGRGAGLASLGGLQAVHEGDGEHHHRQDDQGQDPAAVLRGRGSGHGANGSRVLQLWLGTVTAATLAGRGPRGPPRSSPVAAARVGRAIALGLAEAGCDLVLHYGTVGRGGGGDGGGAEAPGSAGGDRRGPTWPSPAAPARLLAAAGDLAPVRVLVNSAAVFPDDGLAGITAEQWDHTLAVNLRAPVLLTQAFAAALPEGVEGAVVNVTDWRTGAALPGPLLLHRGQGGPRHLHPGRRRGPGSAHPGQRGGAGGHPPSSRQGLRLPQGAGAGDPDAARSGGTDPVVAAVLFLLRNPFVTGEILRVDGGAHLR